MTKFEHIIKPSGHTVTKTIEVFAAESLEFIIAHFLKGTMFKYKLTASVFIKRLYSWKAFFSTRFPFFVCSDTISFLHKPYISLHENV